MSMGEDIREWFIVQPERLLTAGTLVFGSGSILFFGGLWGRVATVAGNAMNRLAKKPEDATLAAMYADLPTWWIPESFAGFVFAAVLIACGLYLAHVGRKLKRLLHHNI